MSEEAVRSVDLDHPESRYAHAVLTAGQAWDAREYSQAAGAAAIAAEAALDAENAGGWWDMTYLQAQCLMKQGQLAECQRMVQHLFEHPTVAESPGRAVRAHQMLSSLCGSLGHLDQAIEHGREGVRLAAQFPRGSTLYIGALRALISALAESGHLDEAWHCCQTLDSLIDEGSARQLLGEVEWVIGNVAFMRADGEEGLKHHERASMVLSAADDLGLWGRFNKASAAVRLAGGFIGQETLEAIERAEYALAVVGAGRREQLELAFLRARWHYLNGQVHEAFKRLEEIDSEKDIIGHDTARDVALLHGRALERLGRNEETVQAFRTGAREQRHRNWRQACPSGSGIGSSATARSQ